MGSATAPSGSRLLATSPATRGRIPGSAGVLYLNGFRHRPFRLALLATSPASRGRIRAVV
jgi:hypothetical protein